MGSTSSVGFAIGVLYMCLKHAVVAIGAWDRDRTDGRTDITASLNDPYTLIGVGVNNTFTSCVVQFYIAFLFNMFT